MGQVQASAVRPDLHRVVFACGTEVSPIEPIGPAYFRVRTALFRAFFTTG
jgi:hypothetical protein